MKHIKSRKTIFQATKKRKTKTSTTAKQDEV